MSVCQPHALQEELLVSLQAWAHHYVATNTDVLVSTLTTSSVLYHALLMARGCFTPTTSSLSGAF